MKHNSLFSANGFHTPIASTTVKSSFLTAIFKPLLLLFLLVMGSSVVWADGYYAVHGNNWQGTDGGQWNDNNNKARMSHQADGVYWCDKVAVSNGTTILFKILYGSGYDGNGFDWGNQKDATLIDNSRGNATLVDDSDPSDHRIQYTATENVDLYIYTNGSAIWANAVPQGTATLDATAYFIQGDLWSGTNGGWDKFLCAPQLTKAPAGELAYVTFYMPTASNSTTTKVRFETYSWDGSSTSDGKYTNCSKISRGSTSEYRFVNCTNASSQVDKCMATISGTGTSHTGAKLVRVEYNKSRTIVTVSDAPAMTGNWYVYINKALKGQLVNGSLTVENCPADNNSGFNSIYLANRNDWGSKNGDIKKESSQGIAWLGGLYIDEAGSDGITWNNGVYYDSGKFSSQNFSLITVSEGKGNDARGGFKLASTSNLRVTLTNGVITLATVSDPDPDPSPSGVTYDGSEIFYFHKNSSGFDWNIWNDNCALYLQFSNADESNTARSTKIGYFWDTDNTSGDVLATRVPAGTWTKVRVIRTNNGNRGQVWNEGSYATLEEGKNYINNSNTMAVYSPRTFHFYISGSSTLAETGSDFNAWNGNGTAHSGSMTKTLNAGTYKFKLNPTGTVDWRSEFNTDDLDLTNSSDNINLRNGGNKEIWFDLATRSEVTIACDGSKVTVNATPYVPALTDENLYVFGDGGTNWVTGWTKNVEDYKMTITTGIASKTFYNVSGSGLNFKVWNQTNSAEYDWSKIDESSCSGLSSLSNCSANNICFNLAQKSDVTVYTDGTKVWLTAVPSPAHFGANQYVFWHSNAGSWGTILAGRDRTQFLEFRNTSTSATGHTSKPAFMFEAGPNDGDNYTGVIAAIAPEGTWNQVRVCRINSDTWNGSPIEGSSDWFTIEDGKNYIYKEGGVIKFGTKSLDNFQFYLAASSSMGEGGNFVWNGNGTVRTNSVTKTLSADDYGFKLNPIGAYIYSGRNYWVSEFNWNDIDLANSSNDISLRKKADNNTEIWFTLSRKSDVTIACNGSKVTVNATPYYNVTFNSDGGSEVDAQSILSGGTVTEPSDPTRGSGYTFNFWKLIGESSAYDFSTPVTSDIELVADWTAPTLYTVTFDSNGGSPVDAQEVVENETATQPADPTRDNYTFGGWKLGNVLYNFSTPVTGNITLVADWSYTPAHISSVSINESSIYTWEGDATTYTLVPTLVPADIASVTVSWSSSDNNVATVVNGVITPQGAGTATITCTATDYYDGSQTATCAVKVAPCAKELAGAPNYSVTITGYNASEGDNATLSDLWNESSDNTEPATLTVCNVRIGNNGGSNEYYAYDNNGTVSIEQRSSDDIDKWYRIEAATNLYYLKNVSTGKYMYVGPTNTSGSKGNGWSENVDWYLRSVYTSATNSETDSYKFYCTKDEWNNDIIVSRADATNNTSRVQPTDFALSRQQLTNTPNVWSDVVANTVSASRGATQGGNNYKGFQSAFENIENVANPAYIQSQMNSSYYRMKENATVQANLGSALAEADVISVELYADAATAVTLCKSNGDVVATINLNADAETEYTYLVTAGTPLDGESAFIIKATDNHAGIRSIAVTPMVTANPAAPDLYWTTTPVKAHLLLDGNFTYTAASSDSQGAISYASENTNIAQVDAQTGEVTPAGAGTTTITATIAADECHATKTIDYEVSFLSLQDYINTESVTSVTLPGDFTSEDIVINKAITINGNDHAIGNLTVEMAGDLTLSGALTVNDFSIYAKAGNSSIHAESGQVRNATNLTANGNAYFYYTVDPNGRVQYGWYDFTVPFPVDVMTGIKGIQESVLKENFINETDYAIMEFLGDNKAEGKYAYKKFRGVMQPNKLYSITLDCSYNYNLIRFQKTNSGALVADESMALPGHVGAEATKNNWNGVGNGTLHHVNIGGVGAPTIQVYQSGDKSFLPVTISDHSLAIGTAFMIQGTETMVFSQANHALLAPSREANTQPMTVQIAREEQPFSDQLFIGADELAGQGYMQGVDVAKAGDLGSAKVAQIWVNAYNSKLCAHEAQLINGRAKYALSLYAPADGTYTLTGMNIPEGSTLYLTKNNKVIWNLGYTCDLDLTKGTSTEYGLLLVESPQISTGVDEIHSDAEGAKKIMHNGILYILRNGKVFNAQGAVMK